MNTHWPPLADLAPIGDRRTAALIGRDATVWWYTAHRFDGAAFLTGLLDAGKGGWRVELPNGCPGSRRYLGHSAVLETELVAPAGTLVVTDWMNIGKGARSGVFCRSFSRAPADARIAFEAWLDNGRARIVPRLVDGVAAFENGFHLFASHPLTLDDNGIVALLLPRGEEGWAALADWPCDPPGATDLACWRQATLDRWAELAHNTTYDGPYRAEVAASLRQLRLLVFEPTGAVAAAATAGLPEVIGGRRNYDYRYSWLRDTAMVVRAMLRTAGPGREGDAFLSFVARAHEHTSRQPLDVVATVDGRPVPSENNPPLAGYEHSNPVRIGNQAGKQLQLGAYGCLLLAAGSVFREHEEERQHWPVVAEVADFLAKHWRKRDSGVWESPKRRHYTASKVFAACGLEAVAPFAEAQRRERYREAAQAIRRYVMQRCLTREGAFATFAGAEGVDVTAALFPVWSFCPPDCREMAASLRVLERDYERSGLFRRDDRTPENRYEGAFLPATFWVAQYWAVRGDAERARRYIQAGLKHANDLGVLPEEVEWESGRALGNLPLGMTHASLINAIVDVKECEERARPSPPADTRASRPAEPATQQ